jgi:hypothetical protein
MKQTSIDWLWNLSLIKELMAEDFEQAKEMHKQEMKECWKDGFRFDSKYKNFEEYYQETFKKN